MKCRKMLCHVMKCNVMLCNVQQFNVTKCRDIVRNFVLFDVVCHWVRTPAFFALWYKMSCNFMPCYVVLFNCHCMSKIVMSCHVMFYILRS